MKSKPSVSTSKHPEHTPLNLGMASFSVILVLALSIFALATQEQRIQELSRQNKQLRQSLSVYQP